MKKTKTLKKKAAKHPQKMTKKKKMEKKEWKWIPGGNGEKKKVDAGEKEVPASA